MASAAPTLPIPPLQGRLVGAASMADDSRIDQRVVRALAACGLAGAEPPAITAASPLDEIHRYYCNAETVCAEALARLAPECLREVAVERRRVGDGAAAVDVLIFDPIEATGAQPAVTARPRPAIIQLHSGG